MAQTKMTIAEVRNPVETVRAARAKAKFDLLDDLLDAMKTVTYTVSGAIDPHASLAILRPATDVVMTLADGTLALETVLVKNAGPAAARVVITTPAADTGTEVDLAAGDNVKLIWSGSAWNHVGHAAAGGSFVSAAHGESTGVNTFYYASSGAIPTGAAALTKYWLIVTDVNSFELATSQANALAGIPITITSDGSGTQTLTKLIDAEGADATANTIEATGHGIADETKVRVEAHDGGVLPAPLVAATDYWVTDGGAADSFQLSASLVDAQAPTPIDLSTAGTLPFRILQLAFKTITAVNHA